MGKELDGKVAAVTGAARGLGRETAKALADAGADVLVANIQEERGHQAAAELAKSGARSLYLRTDVSQVAGCRGVIAETVGQLGRLDILGNNAGICPLAAIPDVAEELWDGVMAVNLKGRFFCFQAASAVM